MGSGPEVLRLLGAERCSAILRTHDPGLAREAMAAAVRGGFRVVEITLSFPEATDVIRDLARDPHLLVGAGTVLTPEQAQASVAAGARFLVSPVCDLAVIAWAHRLGVVPIPGTATPTEMWQAHRAGVEVVKLFPAAEKGPDYVRACLGPMPFLRIVPTSGVTEANAAEFLRAGAFAVGFVASLFPAEDLAARAFDRIEARARRMVAAVRAVGAA